ncbi:MAG: hypothetical protein AAFU54_02310 [Chloroflexota bacterium]
MILQKLHKTMFQFLTWIWEKDKKKFGEDLPILLGDMIVLDDGSSSDPALIEDINKLLEESKTTNATSEYGYELMIKFLLQYAKRGEGGGITALIKYLQDNRKELGQHWLVVWNN